jgi:hypothetical protein
LFWKNWKFGIGKGGRVMRNKIDSIISGMFYVFSVVGGILGAFSSEPIQQAKYWGLAAAFAGYAVLFRLFSRGEE